MKKQNHSVLSTNKYCYVYYIVTRFVVCFITLRWVSSSWVSSNPLNSPIKPARNSLSLEEREQTHHAKVFFGVAIRGHYWCHAGCLFHACKSLSTHTFAVSQNALLLQNLPHAGGEVTTSIVPVSNQFSQLAVFTRRCIEWFYGNDAAFHVHIMIHLLKYHIWNWFSLNWSIYCLSPCFR